MDSQENACEDQDSGSVRKTTSTDSCSQSGLRVDLVGGLKEEIANLEALVEQLEAINADQKAQIERLQKERTRRASVLKAEPVVEEVESTETDTAAKLDQFFKLFQMKNVSNAQLTLHSVNSLVSAHQVVYAKDTSEDTSAPPPTSDTVMAPKIAFNYFLLFMKQINERRMSGKYCDFGYPISWLLSLFPYTLSADERNHPEKITDLLWMPLHFALAIDSTAPGFDNDAYIADLETLLAEYGAAAFEEDVSPLSVAVSLPQPNLDAVRLILEYRSDALHKTDEDGSLPFMHACANNIGTETLAFLYEQNPGAAKAKDSFGCAAIHYAAFNGCTEVVQYLLQVEPTCVSLVEGNGALPIHDAVQNRRMFGTTDMVEVLLQADPSCARKRDDDGAFPLHRAAKFATLNVVQLLHKAFPKAVFAADAEDLLPMHYVAERHDKDEHLDLLQFIVQANPQSKVLDDAALFAVDKEPTASQGGWLRSMWGGGSKTAAPAASPAPAPTKAAPAAASSGGGRFASAPATSPPAAHNKRKSVRPVRGSIHEKYKR